MTRDIMDVFPDRVIPEPNSGCWLWGAATTAEGYGVFRKDGKNHYAHRYSCEIAHGDMSGFLALHKCDNPTCVNPLHLERGSKAKNSIDAFARGLNVSIKGEDHRCSKITENDVRDIRSNPHPPLKILADKYGLSISHIKQIRCRAKWRHVA